MTTTAAAKSSRRPIDLSSDTDRGGMSKIARYGWIVHDTAGKFMQIHKTSLNVDGDYQRHVSEKKVSDICREWSWVACGVISVARRSDGTFWVMDGQHRVLGAMRRSDIQTMPCMVWNSDGKVFEARSFVLTNTLSRPIGSHEKFNARVVGQEEFAITVKRICDEVGLTVLSQFQGSNKTPGTTRIISGLLNIVESDGEDGLREILKVCMAVCHDRPVSKIILDGVATMRRRIDDGLSQKLVSRLIAVGATELEKKAREYVALTGKAGATSYARGMLEAVNRWRGRQFEFKP